MKDYLFHCKTRRVAHAVCPRCGGFGTMYDGSTCYYCQGSGVVD